MKAVLENEWAHCQEEGALLPGVLYYYFFLVVCFLSHNILFLTLLVTHNMFCFNFLECFFPDGCL